MIKNAFSILLGGVVTFALVVFMAYMVSQTSERVEAVEDEPLVFVEVIREETLKVNNRLIPKKPPPPKNPPPPRTVINEEDKSMANNMPKLDLADLKVGFKGEGAYFGTSGFGPAQRDGEATPIVRIEPQYPTVAAREGKEGFVELSFTINTDGTVGNIKVINAKPRKIFNREARRALSRWKYKPKMVDGKAVAQHGIKVKLEFNLES